MTTPLASPDALKTTAGGYAMLAIDQRESLRTMLANAASVPAAEIPDQALIEFKTAAVRALALESSAVLIDRGFGDQAIAELARIAPGRLILSADILQQSVGGALENTYLDPSITTEVIASTGASAIKMLVLWADANDNEGIIAQAREFIELAAAAGVGSLLEAIVRPAPGENWKDEAQRHAAIIEAGRKLCALNPTIYKAQVPGYTVGDLSRVEQESRKLSAAIDVPWVVLSNGVASADFPAAVQFAVAGGAQGFLAGRAIWADVIASEEIIEGLGTVSVERLRRLSQLVADRRD
jgi:sulfofructosephosphate aldolase